MTPRKYTVTATPSPSRSASSVVSVPTGSLVGFAVCDRCSIWYNITDLTWQFQYAGPNLQNLRLLVCKECLDVPQIQLKTIIIPPDPVPVLNPRPESYDVTVNNFLETQAGQSLATEDGQAIIWEYQDTPLPDPNNPVLLP